MPPWQPVKRPAPSASTLPSSAAVAVGPYSQGVEADRLIFLSGQTPLDPATGALVGGGIEEQTRRCLDNLAAVLEGAGLGLDDVVKCTVFLTDMTDFAAVTGRRGLSVPAGDAPWASSDTASPNASRR